MADMWQQWLQELRALDPEAPAWEQSNTFVEAVRTIASDKAVERAAIRLRRRIDADVVALQPALKTWLDYADGRERPVWAAAGCPGERLEEALQQVADLATWLGNFKDLEGRPHPATRSERQQLHEQMEAADGHIEGLLEDLGELLKPDQDAAAARPAPEPAVTHFTAPVSLYPRSVVVPGEVKVGGTGRDKVQLVVGHQVVQSTPAVLQESNEAARPASVLPADAAEQPVHVKAAPVVGAHQHVATAGRPVQPLDQPSMADLVKRLQALSKHEES